MMTDGYIDGYFENHVIYPALAGRLGQPLPDDAEAWPDGPDHNIHEFCLAGGLCATDGPNYWDWYGVVEVSTNGYVRMIGVRVEFDADGNELGSEPHNRHFHLPSALRAPEVTS